MMNSDQGRSLGRPVVAFLLLFLSACGSREAVDDGSRIPTYGVERLLRVGSIEGADAFASITDLAVTPDGDRVIVLENQTRLVKFLDEEGQVIAVAGGSGGGPGEFGNPMGVGVFRDTVWVADVMNYRYSLYSRDGVFLSDFRPTILASQSPDDRPPRPGALLDDGSLLGSTTAYSRDIALGLVKKTPRLLMDRAGTVLDTLAWRSLTNTTWMIEPDPPDPQRGAFYTRQPFRPTWPSVISGLRGRIYQISANDSAGAVLISTDLAGREVFRTPLDWTGPEVTDADVKRVLDEWAVRLSELRVGTDIPRAKLREWLEASLYVPDRLTPIQGMKLDPNGDIWLLLNRTDPRAPNRWRVVTEDGNIKQDVLVPAGIGVREVVGGVLWGVERDEMDVSYLVKLKVDGRIETSS